MVLPTQPVLLDTPQVEELAKHLSSFRHDVNGCLSLIVAATELIRYNPDVVRRMAATITEQPPRIAGKTREFLLECERVIGARSEADPSWYRDLWKRHNGSAGEATGPVTMTADTAKKLHSELLQLGKELMQVGFIVTGAHVLASTDAAAGGDVTLTASEQMTKLTKKFDQLTGMFEQAAQLNVPPPRRLASGTPSGPVTLSVDQLALFHRRLLNLERDITEQLLPLLDLSKLARFDPKQVQARAPEFAQQPPKVSAIVTQFAAEFDTTFHIKRTAA